jgi:UDP-N-acetylmuramyl pentapeptide phosphotransferase/UDP-N-acetylglucosamine-1-phosphate transferase
MSVSEITYWSLISLLLFSGELVYFKMAERFSIIDKPNQRSSHSVPVIRGGGIVFIMAIICWYVTNNFSSPFFVIGALLIAIVSFLDDIISFRYCYYWLNFGQLVGQSI